MRRIILFVSLIITAASLYYAPFANAATQTPDIVSLGDSVAAGVGLNPLSGSSNEQCGRSSQAYPALVARSLNESILQLACSGAKVNDGIYGSQTVNGTTISPQLEQAFKNGVPKQIIVTIGANDMRWYELIKQCYAYTCGTRVDSARALAYRADLRYELGRMIYQIRNKSKAAHAATPKIYLGGYYLPFTDASCIVSSQRSGSITTTEQQWVAQQTVKLNDAIESVASVFRDVEFVPVSFSGHEACAADPWVQGIDAAYPLHPTARGQAVIAQSFVRTMKSQL